MSTGQALKNEGMDAVLAADTAAHRNFQVHIENALAQLIKSKTAFSADDIRRLLPDGAVPHHPNVIGAAVRAAASKKRIRPVGWVTSRTPSRHGGAIREWRAA